ncbi:MAG: hypothetical protein JXB45_09095 [Candidatus Krumholzibacteriota bacterium]|nr:hypothetical protein [Candidatus Krumholzibacteriota bacterium]
MKEIILFSTLSFILILFGVLYSTGYIQMGPQIDIEPVTENEKLSLIKIQLEAIGAQKAELENKREEIATLQSELEIEKKIVSENRENLKELQDRIGESLNLLEEEQQVRIDKLAKLYDSMKPEQAAPIAASLNMNLLVEIIVKMKEKKASKLMAAMPVTTSAEISRRLGKNKDI